jgi:hypothetical protein
MHGALNNTAATNSAYFYFRNQKFATSTDEDDNPKKIEELKATITKSGLPYFEFSNAKEMADKVVQQLSSMLKQFH